MGGGVGVSINAAHRVAGERFSFAMPEVGIGFFPDVGGTYFLPRLERRAGVYLALTGLRANAGDALAFGLAETFVPSAAFGPLAPGARGRRRGRRDRSPVSPPSRSPLRSDGRRKRARNLLCAGQPRGDPLGAESDRSARVSRLRARPARRCWTKSPTSQSLALRQMAMGPRVDFDEALRIEYRIVSRVCLWPPASMRAFARPSSTRITVRPGARRRPQAEIDGYFAPLGDLELTFPAVPVHDLPPAPELRRRDRVRRRFARASARTGRSAP